MPLLLGVPLVRHAVIYTRTVITIGVPAKKINGKLLIERDMYLLKKGWE